MEQWVVSVHQVCLSLYADILTDITVNLITKIKLTLVTPSILLIITMLDYFLPISLFSLFRLNYETTSLLKPFIF